LISDSTALGFLNGAMRLSR